MIIINNTIHSFTFEGVEIYQDINDLTIQFLMPQWQMSTRNDTMERRDDEDLPHKTHIMTIHTMVMR